MVVFSCLYFFFRASALKRKTRQKGFIGSYRVYIGFLSSCCKVLRAFAHFLFNGVAGFMSFNLSWVCHGFVMGFVGFVGFIGFCHHEVLASQGPWCPKY